MSSSRGEALARGSARERRPAGREAEAELAAHLFASGRGRRGSRARRRRSRTPRGGARRTWPPDRAAGRAAHAACAARSCSGEVSSYSSWTPKRSASHSIAPTKSRFSCFSTNVIASPPSPQPKHLKVPAVGRDAEARRLLLVERAETDVAAPGLPQARVALDERDDVGRGLDRLDRCVLDPRHQSVSQRTRARSGRSSRRRTRRPRPASRRARPGGRRSCRTVSCARRVLGARVLGEVDALEHEVAQAGASPRRSSSLWRMSPAAARGLDEVVDEPVDALATPSGRAARSPRAGRSSSVSIP